jgi:signal transduction histidine kinase
MLFVAYRLRIRQVARQLNRDFDARISERTRIARDLHDTLLQSFVGLLLRLAAASSLLPARPDEAKERLDRAVNDAQAALTEGRDAVQRLRASAVTANDLANGIAALAADLTGDPSAGSPPAIAVNVEGASRDLNPVVREEAYRIAGEALRNAVKHAQARKIAVTIHYEARQFRVVICDDGKGIDAVTLQQQQPAGHFGLPGIRERAAIVRGQLDVRSQLGAGTEIELRVPGRIAYRRSTRRSPMGEVGAPG